jgi:hypothetical protein
MVDSSVTAIPSQEDSGTFRDFRFRRIVSDGVGDEFEGLLHSSLDACITSSLYACTWGDLYNQALAVGVDSKVDIISKTSLTTLDCVNNDRCHLDEVVKAISGQLSKPASNPRTVHIYTNTHSSSLSITYAS